MGTGTLRRNVAWLLQGQLDGRYFPISDHHSRPNIIGEAERCLHLFQQLYNRNPQNFSLAASATCSLWLWVVSSFPGLLFLPFRPTSAAFSSDIFLSAVANLSGTGSSQTSIGAGETLLVVVSSDLRQHPVGRFGCHCPPAS